MIARWRREIAILVAYGGILLVLAVAAPGFFQAENWRSLAVATGPVAVAAMGMTLVILCRQIDISIGSQAGLCAVGAGLLAGAGWPMPVVALATVGLGGTLGAVNGALIAGAKLPSIVVTLATLVIERESLRWWREGEFVRGLPSHFQWFGLSQTSGRWVVVGVSAAVVVGLAVGLRFLPVGRSVYATGSDAEAARLAGLRPDRVLFGSFVVMGMMAGLYALLTVIQFPTVDPKVGTGLELQTIAAVVIGGVAISGGRGTPVGALLGVVLLATINPALIYLGISASWGKAIEGAVILLAVTADRLIRKGKRG